VSEKADEKTVARERVGAAERKRRVERYQRVMGPSIDERLWVDRAKLVAVYLKNPSVFPNGPDSRAWGGEAWYEASEWRLLEDGSAVREVAFGRGVVAEDATKPTPATKPLDATKPATEGDATKPFGGDRGGRPRVGERALSSTERSRLRRERLKGKEGEG